ncbi:hypothetical protein LCGC14_0861620 [marine sediment metagenome]|uniref:Uncharacterized protein n=1 Tax=marine sediment metagenome TaxID=412755 RepID=A0A0F9SEB1_9ZZZZ
MARSLSAELQTAQDTSPYKVYIELKFIDSASGETDYSLVHGSTTNRLLYLQHDEFPYDDSATIILLNNDLGVGDLKGHYVEIGYGHNTTDHGGSGNESSGTSRQWVEDQQFVSSQGVLVCQITLEGMKRRLMRKLILTVDGVTVHDGVTDVTDPDFPFKFTDKTYYQILEYIIETEMGWTLLPLGDQDDGIINTTVPEFEINYAVFEYAGLIIERIMNETKCYLRFKAGLEVEVIYPQDDDAVDLTFYSNQQHFFKEYNEKDSVLIPNHVIVYGNKDEELEEPWANIIVKEAEDVATNEQRVTQIHILGGLREPQEVQNAANAILARYQAQRTSGFILTSHVNNAELFDRALIFDTRGS